MSVIKCFVHCASDLATPEHGQSSQSDKRITTLLQKAFRLIWFCFRSVSQKSKAMNTLSKSNIIWNHGMYVKNFIYSNSLCKTNIESIYFLSKTFQIRTIRMLETEAFDIDSVRWFFTAGICHSLQSSRDSSCWFWNKHYLYCSFLFALKLVNK